MNRKQIFPKFGHSSFAVFLTGGFTLALLGGNGAATAAGRDCKGCPLPQACPPSYQYQVPIPPSDDQFRSDRGFGQPSDPTNAPIPFGSGQSQPQFDFAEVPEASSDVGDFDLSSGLATNFGAGGATSLAFSDNGGYLDSPIVRNQIRLRFDASYDNPTPDRAEFLYPKCGCFGPPAPGPLLEETGIDYQEFSLYAESLLCGDLISGFIEIPFRLINPDVNANKRGLSDINLGIRAALWITQRDYLTFQFRTFLPSGDGRDGLGTEHVTLEPGLLFLRRYCNGMMIQGEIRDYIPIDGTDGWAGNVLRYGMGISQAWYEDGEFSISPVLETVAWSVLSGDVLTEAGVESAETTIVNIKLGTRFAIAPRCRGQAQRSFYIGYGKALTNDRWYDDTLRAEYRLAF